jgi:hypothetical protein
MAALLGQFQSIGYWLTYNYVRTYSKFVSKAEESGVKSLKGGGKKGLLLLFYCAKMAKQRLSHSRAMYSWLYLPQV